MIPPFDADGTLPLGRYGCTMSEIRQRLVDPFTESNHRRPLYDQWRVRREEISRQIPIESEWLGGSYVTLKREPNDLDLATFIDGPTFDGLPEMVREEVLRLVKGHTFRPKDACDAKFIAVFPDGHEKRDAYLRLRGLYDVLWTSQREQGRDRGYVDVRDEQ